MSEENSFHLIKGEFNPAEAGEILLSLINFKIQFHEGKLLSNKIKGNLPDEASINRINDLRASKIKVQKMISHYAEFNTQLELEAEVMLNLVVKKATV